MGFRFQDFFIPFLILGLAGCKAPTGYRISSDPVLLDLGQRIEEMDKERAQLEKDLKDIEKVFQEKGSDLSAEVISSLKREVIEGEFYKRAIFQWSNYLKIQRKKRYHSLKERKERGVASLSQKAQRESEAYFSQKKLKPIPKTWLQRYRTVIEL